MHAQVNEYMADLVESTYMYINICLVYVCVCTCPHVDLCVRLCRHDLVLQFRSILNGTNGIPQLNPTL